jgi:hypothetical protein
VIEFVTGPVTLCERRLRLPGAVIIPDSAAPVPPGKSGREPGTPGDFPACADVAQLVEHFTRKDALRGVDCGVGLPSGPSECLQTRVISRVGRLATRAQDKPRVDTCAALFAAPVQPGCDPDTRVWSGKNSDLGDSGERALDLARALALDLPCGTLRSVLEVALD